MGFIFGLFTGGLFGLIVGMAMGKGRKAEAGLTTRPRARPRGDAPLRGAPTYRLDDAKTLWADVDPDPEPQPDPEPRPDPAPQPAPPPLPMQSAWKPDVHVPSPLPDPPSGAAEYTVGLLEAEADDGLRHRLAGMIEDYAGHGWSFHGLSADYGGVGGCLVVFSRARSSVPSSTP